MKFLIIISVLLLIACNCAPINGDCESFPKMGGPRVEVGTKVVDHCAEFTCNEDGSWTSSGCGVYTCEDKIGEKPYDYTLPYPECCPRPICKSDTA